uniref:dolichol kinase n=2 Tax=Nyssomyia neivai TaxID=330878 RepID=A0A1L8DYD5_9DIPT
MTTDEIESANVEESEETMTVEGCFVSRKNLDFNCRSRNIQRRPNASDGFWLCVLLPLSLVPNSWMFQKSSTLLYKICGIISLGLFLQSMEILLKFSCRSVNSFINAVTKIIPGICASLLIWYFLQIDLIISFAYGVLCCLLFNFIFLFLLRHLPRSFTLGEATIVSQGLVVFLFGGSFEVFLALNVPPEVEIDQMTAIICVTLLGVLLLCILTYGITFCRRTPAFLLLLTGWAALVMLTPVTDPLPVELLVEFIFLDMGRVCVLLIYGGVAGITGAFVAWKISRKTSTSVSVRKVFHIGIVVVYIIGLIFQCTMLFVLSGLVMALFIVFELIRLIALPMISPPLETIIRTFVDEKDAGVVALTPIYLLTGCSIPLWLHPAPCDLTDGTSFTLLPLIAGVLSVGIGDTMAGVVGSKFGRHKLLNSDKTVEGTLANIASQLAVIFFLHFVGLLHLNLITIIICFVGVIVNAIIEAKTDQIDNLFLPLVTFSIFSLSY